MPFVSVAGPVRTRTEGKATAIVECLDARRIAIPAEARTRIIECSDPDQLDVWIRRAATADAIDDLFACREPLPPQLG